jgi:GNAT superfamily N-acetyltransferase
MISIDGRQAALRGAVAEDADAVAQVLISSRTAFLPYAPLVHSESEVRQWVARTLVPSGGVTVACVGDAIVGVLAVSRAAACSWIDQLYVSPGFVGRGIGTRLLIRAIASLGRPVRLYTFQANLRGRQFYERFGFRAVEFGDGSTNEERCPDVLYELPVT